MPLFRNSPTIHLEAEKVINPQLTKLVSSQKIESLKHIPQLPRLTIYVDEDADSTDCTVEALCDVRDRSPLLFCILSLLCNMQHA